MKFIFFIIVVIFGVCGAYYAFSEDLFETNLPNIKILDQNSGVVYWNPKNSLQISVSDDSGLDEAQTIFASSSGEEKIITTKLENKKDLILKFDFPKNMKYSNGDEYTLKLNVKDTSKANFFSGNTAFLEAKIIIDLRAPDVIVLDHSYQITKGGAAVAVFRANDIKGEIKELFVQTSFGKNFEVFPFYKQGYYAVLLAWPSNEKNFSANIVASDLAGNVSKIPIRLYLQNRAYKESKITLNEKFLNGKIDELAQIYAQNYAELNNIAKFKFVNETLRAANEKKIKEISTSFQTPIMNNFFLKPFYPLKNAAAVASFGDHRYFSFNGKELSQSYHLGLDLASTAAAVIITNNAGKVVFAEENGIYGLNLMLYHGFGLYTLYGHCTNLLVGLDDEVAEGTSIATTGISGLALGDHLHFGVIIQGIEVRPEEWMDKKWMQENIFNILENAKNSIKQTKN